MRKMIFGREEKNVASFLIVTVDLFVSCVDDMVNGNCNLVCSCCGRQGSWAQLRHRYERKVAAHAL